jgi:cleavage and polyadenylation specificity factor subunit 4
MAAVESHNAVAVPAPAPVPALQPTKYEFTFSDFLRREYRFGLDPNRPLCKAYMQGHCPLGSSCPDKHQMQSSYNKCVSPPRPCVCLADLRYL